MHLAICIQLYSTISYSTEDLSVAEGNSAKFICSATGHPQPQIIWQKVPKSSKEKGRIRLVDKNGKEIVQKRIHGQVLELPKVSRRDMGTYLCIAKNNVPPAVSKNFKLTVNCKRYIYNGKNTFYKCILIFSVEPQIEVQNQMVGAPLDTDIVLKCSIQASPKPMTFWKRKSDPGGMIVPSLKYNISDQSLSDYQFVSTLHIKSLKKEDFAQYVCVAKNTIGKSEEMIKIHEIEREIPIISTEEYSTSTKLYRYEEYHTQQPTYRSRTDVFTSNTKGKDVFDQKKKNKDQMDTSSSFKVHLTFCLIE